MWVKVAQSCPALCDSMDYTVHGILQARIPEWVAFLFSRGLPNPEIQPMSPPLQADFYQLSQKGSLCFDRGCIKSVEKAMAPHSSTLTWRIPWTEEPGRLQSRGSRRVGHDWAPSLSLFLSCIEGGNGNPLQCSCLENPRDGGAWWAAVYGGHTELDTTEAT